MKKKKINSIHFGGKMIAAAVLLGFGLPAIVYIFTKSWNWLFGIPGLLILIAFLIIFSIEMKQDNAAEPFYEKNLRETIPFNPEKQQPIIRSSICTGEKMAGFKDKTTGHFTEVMVIRSDDDKARFMKIYNIHEVTTEY